MTTLSERKTRLTFETDTMVRAKGRSRALVVEPEPLVCVIRPKGTRQRYAISWETIFVRAAELEAHRLREERRKARLTRKRGI